MTRKLTRSEIARLGGLARAQKTTAAERQLWSARGGQTCFERHGKYHYVRAAYIRHGLLEAPERPER